jgi:hypothetical protein
MEEVDGPLLVGIPERLDRRLRLGPFGSGRDALKFLLYAAAGAVLAPLVSVWVGLPIVAAGLVTTTWRPGGEAIDERAAAVAAWSLRRVAGEAPVRRRPSTGPRRRSWISLGPSRVAALLRAGGVPLAYLPAAELRRRFELFRDALRGGGGCLAFLATSAPIFAGALVPAAPSPGGNEGQARSGYRELVELIASRRSVRQVFVAVGAAAGPEGISRLEGEVAALVERLEALGARPSRLRDRALLDAAQRLGLAVAEGAP